MRYIAYAIYTVISFIAPSVAFAATITLSPSSGSYSTGDVFSVGVYLNTDGAETVAVDLEAYYPANLLQVVDANPSVTGTQITPGTLMPQVMLNTAENGRVRFAQITPAGVSPYSTKNSSQLFATIPFRAMGPGAASVTIDHTPGSTRDSNISKLGGIDLLTSVTNASFTITGTAISPSSYTFTFMRNLMTGATGEDVRALQKFLNGQGFLVASSGAGSPGMETTYFGGRTKSALVRFQETHAAEILAPVGLTRGSGYFGPNTRNKIYGLLRLTLPPQASSQAQSQISQLQEQIRQAQEQVNQLTQKLQKTQ